MVEERYIRIYKKFYFDELKAHTLLYGMLSGSCSACKEVDVKLDATVCPACKQPFKFIAFQNVRDHLPKMKRLAHERPDVLFIDYDDYKRLEGEERAKSILG